MNDEKKLDAAIDKAFDKLSNMPKEEFMRLIYPPRFYLGYGFIAEDGAKLDWEFSEVKSERFNEEYLSLSEHEAILSEERARLRKLCGVITRNIWKDIDDRRDFHLDDLPRWIQADIKKQWRKIVKKAVAESQPTEDKSGEEK